MAFLKFLTNACRIWRIIHGSSTPSSFCRNSGPLCNQILLFFPWAKVSPARREMSPSFSLLPLPIVLDWTVAPSTGGILRINEKDGYLSVWNINTVYNELKFCWNLRWGKMLKKGLTRRTIVFTQTYIILSLISCALCTVHGQISGDIIFGVL